MQDAVVDPVIGIVGSGKDVRLEGAAAPARLEALAGQLGEGANVIRVMAPPGGLSLSALIAQLSGREKFDEQDDSALEVGFRRLSGADTPGQRTVLLLDASAGVQRPVLRYLQQIGRAAPRLQFVIAGFPELEGLLSAPDMVRLRDRLGAALETGPTVPSAPVHRPSVPAVTLPADWTLEARRRASVRERRKSRRVALLWASSGLALAASVAIGAWVGQTGTPAPAMPTQAKAEAAPVKADRPTALTLRPEPAHVAEPTLAGKVAPVAAGSVAMVAAVAPANVPAAVPAPALAKAASPEAAPPGEPAVAAKSEPVILAHVSGQAARPRTLSRSKVALSAPAIPRERQEERAAPSYGAEEEPMPARRRFGSPAELPSGAYGRQLVRPYDEPDTRADNDQEYMGTYSTGPYGARVFRYWR